MNRDETKRLMTEIAHLFPRFINADEDKTLKVDLWAEALETYEFSEMHNALMIYTQDESKGFPPSVGQLIDIMKPEPDPLLPKDHVFMGW